MINVPQAMSTVNTIIDSLYFEVKDDPNYWQIASTTNVFPLGRLGNSKGRDRKSMLGFKRSAVLVPDGSVIQARLENIVVRHTLDEWQPITAISAGDLVWQQVAPGVIPNLWRSNSTRTTGATFDAAEQANFTEESGSNGGDGRARRFCTILNNGIEGQWALKNIQVESGIWETLVGLQDATRHSVNIDQPLRMPRTLGFTPGTPTTGSYFAGQQIDNVGASAAGDPVGWRCITSGTPGVWDEIPK